MKRQPAPEHDAPMAEWTAWFYAEAARNNRNTQRWALFGLVWCVGFTAYFAWLALTDDLVWLRFFDAAIAGLLVWLGKVNVENWRAARRRAKEGKGV